MKAKHLPRVSAVAILFLLAPPIAGFVALPLLWCVRVWHWSDWLATLLGCVLTAGLLFGIWRLVVELVGRRFRFTLRTMIVAIAVLALIMGTLGHWWIKFASQYRSFHGLMAYGAVFDSARYGGSQRHKALYRWFGYDPFETEHDLSLTSDRALHEALRHAEELPDVAQLSFESGVTASGFAEATGFNRFTKATYGQFIESNIDAAGLARLGEWTKLRQLFLNGCPQVTDAGLAELTVLPDLESLVLIEEGGGMKIGDAGLAQVGKMQSLKKLMLVNMPNMTDAGFAELHKLQRLEVMVLRNCGVTEAGLRQLHAALLNCRIEADTVVEGPRNVRQVVVRRLDAADAAAQTITDPKAIAALLKLTDIIKQQNLLEPRFQVEPRAAEFELTFAGQSQTLWKLRFDGSTLQEQSVHQFWNHWPTTSEQAAELKRLVGAGD
jgi:hypothetical protein